MNHTHWLSHKSNCSSCSFLNTLWSLYSTIQSWVVSSTISVIFSPTSVKKSYGKGDLNSSEDATREAMQKRRNQAHSCPSAQHGKKSRVRSHAKATRTYDWPNKKEIEEDMSKKKKIIMAWNTEWKQWKEWERKIIESVHSVSVFFQWVNPSIFLS